MCPFWVGRWRVPIGWILPLDNFFQSLCTAEKASSIMVSQQQCHTMYNVQPSRLRRSWLSRDGLPQRYVAYGPQANWDPAPSIHSIYGKEGGIQQYTDVSHTSAHHVSRHYLAISSGINGWQIFANRDWPRTLTIFSAAKHVTLHYIASSSSSSSPSSSNPSTCWLGWDTGLHFATGDSLPTHQQFAKFSPLKHSI